MSNRRARGPHNRITPSHNPAGCPLAMLLAVCCCLSAANAQWLETKSRPAVSRRPQFSAEEVRQQVSANRRPDRPSVPSTTSFDGGEFMFDTAFHYIQALKHQCAVAVGYNGSDFLLVWQDGRSDVYSIYGTRVSAAGAVLDSIGIPIAPIAGQGLNPAISFDGSNYLVVWEDYRNGVPDIYGAFVDADGTLLDTVCLRISYNLNGGLGPAVAFDGTNYLVVWWDDEEGIWGARVTPVGQVLDTISIPVSTAYYSQNPDVAFDGDNFLVVWQDDRAVGNMNIYGARVAKNGVVLDTANILISGAMDSQAYPAIVYDGSDYLVVWQDRRRVVEWDIYGARVTPAGAVPDTAGIMISTSDRSRYYPAVAFDGTNSFVIWQDYRYTGAADLYAARVNTAGLVLDSAGIVISSASNDQNSPAVAFGGTRYLVAWEDRRYNVSWADIFAARVSTEGVVLDPSGLEVSFAGYNQYSPAVGFNGSDFLAAWADVRSDSADIYGARVASDGVLLDTGNVRISACSSQQRSPTVASDGMDFLVAWEDSRSGPSDIYGTRVSASGQVLDTLGILVSGAAGNQLVPAAAFNGSDYLVAWQDRRSGVYNIYGSRVTSVGVVLDPAGIPISTATYSKNDPAVATDGANYLVVWSNAPIYQTIYGARVSPAGVVLDPSGITISNEAYRQELPAVAYDGTNFLVVWTTAPQPNPHYNYYAILGARVTPEGAVLDSPAIQISPLSGNRYRPDVAFDGANYLVMWEDKASGSFHPDVRGARITPYGTVLDTFTAVAQEGGQYDPKLAHGPGHRVLLVYRGWVRVNNGVTYNTHRVWGRMGPFGAVEEPSADGVRFPIPVATVTRGVLFLPDDASRKPRATSRLLDIGGRKVLDLKRGANDVRALAPGVYFVREAQAQAQARAIHKVVITR